MLTLLGHHFEILYTAFLEFRWIGKGAGGHKWHGVLYESMPVYRKQGMNRMRCVNRDTERAGREINA